MRVACAAARPNRNPRPDPATESRDPPVHARWPDCGAAHAEYRTEPETFSRVALCGQDAAGPLAFVVRDKDGRIRRFGTDASSRVETDVLDVDLNGNPKSTTLHRRFGWLLARVEDRAGNYMTYSYGRQTGIDMLEWWPQQISYTGFGSSAPTRRVVFEYESRTDLLSGYLRGIELRHTRRLSAIKTPSDQGAVPGIGLQSLFTIDVDGDARDDLFYTTKADPNHAMGSSTWGAGSTRRRSSGSGRPIRSCRRRTTARAGTASATS
ncbi:MAG TPA: hypothetical protein VFT22_32815 [Kofleriaceae bacterium]|nr:hypothetical protein [Kofleriaceae bacterium]